MIIHIKKTMSKKKRNGIMSDMIINKVTDDIISKINPSFNTLQKKRFIVK